LAYLNFFLAAAADANFGFTRHFITDPNAFGATSAPEFNVGNVDRGSRLEHLTLLAFATRLLAALAEINALNNNFRIGREHADNLALLAK
jgi:hypothetical protein